MLRPQGYAVWDDPDGQKVERDTFTCKHCQRITFVAPRQSPSDAGGFCRRCDSLICGPCVDKDQCTPWLKKLEVLEREIERTGRRDLLMKALS